MDSQDIDELRDALRKARQACVNAKDEQETEFLAARNAILIKNRHRISAWAASPGREARSVPEPGSLALLATAVAAMAAWRMR